MISGVGGKRGYRFDTPSFSSLLRSSQTVDCDTPASVLLLQFLDQTFKRRQSSFQFGVGSERTAEVLVHRFDLAGRDVGAGDVIQGNLDQAHILLEHGDAAVDERQAVDPGPDERQLAPDRYKLSAQGFQREFAHGLLYQLDFPFARAQGDRGRDGDCSPPPAAYLAGPRDARLRQGEKVLALCRHAWKVVHRLYPEQFDRNVPNPWVGVVKKRRALKTKAAATRDKIHAFACKAIELGYAEAAGAAVICFEWLQRPENVLAGYVRWSDYRDHEAPNAIRIERLYCIRSRTPTAPRSMPMPKRCARQGAATRCPDRSAKAAQRSTNPYSPDGMSKVVRKIRALADLPSTFTLDACRHGGMTELEEAELTDGQGRALSAHTNRAYEGYAKRTMERALAATRKRYAHRLANDSGEQRHKVSEFAPAYFRN